MQNLNVHYYATMLDQQVETKEVERKRAFNAELELNQRQVADSGAIDRLAQFIGARLPGR